MTLEQHYWGRFEPKSNIVDIHDQEKTEDKDLLDFAGIYTFLTGRIVDAVEPETIADHSTVAATFSD